MKGSSVAFRFKSLADRLHPQLPLSPKESQKLLSAVTGSFRKQLDEAHPWSGNVPKGASRPSSRRPSQGEPRETKTSSALLTDRHLASVLTNPLVARPAAAEKHGLDYVTAKTALETGAETEPMRLFERCAEKNCLTVPLALLCLRSLTPSLETLKEDDRQHAYHGAQAGKRTLKWLLESGMLHDEQLFSNTRFTKILVSFLVKEGNERFVWEWIKINNPVVVPSHQQDENAGSTNFVERGRRFQMTGLLLDAFVTTKLEQQLESCAAALETFIKACDIVEGRDYRATDGLEVSLSPAGRLLLKVLTAESGRRSMPSDLDYDRFIAAMPLWAGRQRAFLEFNQGLLRLLHPSKPTAKDAYRLLHTVLGGSPPAYAQALLQRFENQKTSDQGNKLYNYMLRTAELAGKEGFKDEASWVFSKAKHYFPHLARSPDGTIKSAPRPGKTTRKAAEETDLFTEISLHPSYG